MINAGDNIDDDHLDILLDYCDSNGDGQIEPCEVHACVVMCEN